MKKRLLALLLAAVMTLAITACPADPAGDGGTNPPATNDDGTVIDLGNRTQIDIFTFTEETKEILDFAMEKAYPDFNERFFLNYILEGDDDAYITKVENGLESNSPPHLFVADVRYARRFAANRQTANLSDLGVTYNASELFKYTIDIMTIGGNVKGLSHQATPGSVFYRKSIAEGLGLGDAAAVQQKMSTWDGFIDLARDLKAQGVFAVYALDEIKFPFLNARDSGWVTEEGYLNIDEATMKDFFNVSTQLYQIGAYAYSGTGQWSGGWWSGMRGQAGENNDTDVFAYFGCTWFLHYCLKGNTLPGGGDEYNALIDEGKTDADLVGMGTFGDWNMAPGPAGYFWGGTYWFGSVAASQNDAIKEGVAMIIETVATNKEVMKAYNIHTGDFSGIKSVGQELGQDANFSNPFLAGQNHYETFVVAAETVDASKNITIYDADFDSYFSDSIGVYFRAIDLGASADEAYNTAMATFVNLTRAGLPSILIPDDYAKFADGAIELPPEEDEDE